MDSTLVIPATNNCFRNIEIVNSTTSSSVSSGSRNDSGLEGTLELPDGELCRSLPPLVSTEEMFQRIRQLRAWFPAGLRISGGRWKAKTAVKFRL